MRNELLRALEVVLVVDEHAVDVLGEEVADGALDDAGGQEYLATQAKENPNAFMTLVGKVLPLQVGGSGSGIRGGRGSNGGGYSLG